MLRIGCKCQISYPHAFVPAYTYRLAGKPSGLLDNATTIKYASGRGTHCMKCFTGYVIMH